MLRARSRDRGGRGSAWYKSTAYLLNNVAPTLIHDYASQRYYDTSRGPTAFPLTFTRLSNATMFDSSGNLVWAPANMIPQSSTSGAVVGVLGSGGALPTGWAWSVATGLIREILAVTPNYIDVRISGTNATGSIVYPQITALNTPVSASASEGFCGSMYAQIIDSTNVSGLSPSALKVNTQYLNSGSYVNENTPSPQATTTEQRLISKGSAPASGINQVRVSLNLTVIIGGTVDISLRVRAPQLEKLDLMSPKTYIETTGSAYYGPRFDYDPLTLVPRGILIEEPKTNIQPISMGVTSNWTANFSTITNAGATILGNTAYTFTTIATSGQFAFITVNPGALAASTLYTSSIRVKKGNHSRVQFTVTNYCFQPTAADAYANYNFDTDTLTVLGSSLPAPTGTRTLCSDGSVIISLTYTTGTVPVAGASGIVCCVDTDAAVRLAGTTTNGATVHVLGIQCEAGAFVSSYIPTSGVSATRAEETLSISTSGWITSNTGAMFAQFSQPYVDSTSASHGVATTDGLARWIYTIQGTVRAYDGTTLRVGPAYTANTQMKAVLALIGGNMRQSVNGAAVGVSVFDGTMTPDATLQVGSQFGPTTKLNGWVKEIRYYPAGSPSDAQLQALTA